MYPMGNTLGRIRTSVHNGFAIILIDKTDFTNGKYMGL